MNRMHPSDLRAIVASNLYGGVRIPQVVMDTDALLAELERTAPKPAPGCCPDSTHPHQFTAGYCGVCGAPDNPPPTGSWVEAKEYHAVFARAKQAETERDMFLAWKESSMKEWADLDIQAVGKALGVRLGDSIPLSVLPKIRDLRARAETAEARVERDAGIIRAFSLDLRQVLSDRDNLLYHARKAYRADGTFTIYDTPQEVIAWRIECARRIEAAEARVREQDALLVEAKDALGDALAVIESRQIEEQEIRKQLAPLAAHIGILTPEAHSMGYLAKELLPPILAQLAEARAEVATLREGLYQYGERQRAIEAAMAEEPPMPSTEIRDWAAIAQARGEWGRQGWDTAAALRVEVEGQKADKAILVAEVDTVRARLACAVADLLEHEAQSEKDRAQVYDLKRRLESAAALVEDAESRAHAAVQREAKARVDGYRSALNDKTNGELAAIMAPELEQAREEVRKEEQKRYDRLVVLVEDLMSMDDTPERNCSCHLSPPCDDCVTYAGKREAMDSLRSALAPKAVANV